jgi:hypothetical protein
VVCKAFLMSRQRTVAHVVTREGENPVENTELGDLGVQQGGGKDP